MNGRVLLVEDNADTRKLVETFLRAKGFQVVAASDGEEGWEAWQEGQPQVVILDANLPKINGFELLERIRRTPAGKTIPVIMATATYRSEESSKLATEQFKVAHYMTKPFPLHLLVRRVRELMPGEKATVEVRDPRREAPSADAVQPTLPPVGLRGRIEGFSLASVMHRLHRTRMTGVLHLSNGGSPQDIRFLDGHPVWVESTRDAETLSAYLLRQGRISRADHDLWQTRAKQTGREQADVLLDLELPGTSEIVQALQEHLRTKILDCLAWEEGEYLFEERQSFSNELPVFTLNTPRLIIDAFAERFKARQLERILGVVGTAHNRSSNDPPAAIARYLEAREIDQLAYAVDAIRVHTAPGPAYAQEQLELTVSEQRIHALAVCGMTVGEICERVPRDKALKLLCALHVLEVVRFYSPSAEEARKQSQSTRRVSERLFPEATRNRWLSESERVTARPKKPVSDGPKSSNGSQAPAEARGEEAWRVAARRERERLEAKAVPPADANDSYRGRKSGRFDKRSGEPKQSDRPKSKKARGGPAA